MTLTTNIRLGVAARQSSTLDLGSADANVTKNIAIALASGTAAGQADRVFSDTRTLAASANEDLDLAGALTDAFGATVTFAKVKAVLIVAAAGNTNNVNVTRPGSNGVPLFLAAGDGVAVRPGGFFALSVGAGDLAAYAVTSGTGDLINVANSGAGTSVTYDVIVVGTSA
jgi:hypothetical protein